MFKNVDDVKNASNETIVEIVGEGWNANLSDILTEEDCDILNKAKVIEEKAENIAFAIRDRFNQIVEDESCEYEDEDDIDEFMNSIAYDLGMHYNGEYEHRPDAFWIPSTC